MRLFGSIAILALSAAFATGCAGDEKPEATKAQKQRARRKSRV